MFRNENPSESLEIMRCFLTSRNRYAKLFENQKGDYKVWAKVWRQRLQILNILIN
jgi:hypothetical protein